MISYCRPYFPNSATEEMLEEWRPLMCPFDVTMNKALAYCEMFLPTYDVGTTFQLWFNELMAFWDACPNLPMFEGHLFALFSRLSDNTCGQLDWSEYIPKFLTRMQLSFDLPVFYKKVQLPKKPGIDVNIAVKWIMGAMNSNPELFDKLEHMFTALDSYYHTANYGRHSFKLTDFLYKLVSAFVLKIYKERYRRKKIWGYNLPEDKKITDDQITKFVQSIMPVALNGMYFKVSFILYSS